MSSVDKRYAEALVDAAELAESLDPTQSELGAFVELYNQQPEFMSFFLTPEIGKKEKKNALGNIFTGSNSILLSFLQLLIDKGRISNLPGIYNEYVQIADKRKKVINLTIRTFATLDDSQLNKIIKKYMKEYAAADVKTTIRVEPELLGGIVVQIGDKVIDASIKGRLKGLSDSTTKMQQLKVI